ncbi:MAG: hypothetical protein HC802_00265 [Caldilineaceae bacterium]|nr:hypothetical protein [Caldilineaceae bacterium]
MLYSWMLLLAGFALLLGVANVLAVHIRRVVRGVREWTHSLALVVSMLVVFCIGLFSADGVDGLLGEWVFDSVIAPGQAMLFGLLVFFMAAAGYQFLRFNRSGGGWMLAGALLMLLAQTPAIGALLSPFLPDLATWFLKLPVTAATRGALLGGSLALVVVSIQLLARRGEK